MKIRKITPPLLWRGVLFFSLFVLISGLLGPRIINGGILYRDGFALYGGLGKAALFGGIALVLLARHNTRHFQTRPWDARLLGWAAAALLFVIIAWNSISGLLDGGQQLALVILAHASLVLSIAACATACMGVHNLRVLWDTYRREVLLASAIAAGFYVFLLGVYTLWQPLAAIVLAGVRGLLTFTNIPAVFVAPTSIMTDKFGITVAQYCSGIESIALFSGLYAIVGLLEWQHLRVRLYLWLFPVALVVLFALNIVRVFALIVVGYYISPAIAFSLFHTYAGMVFFILYSAAFWAIAYKHVISQRRAPHTQATTALHP